jgi:hypothetical protein
VLVPSNPKSDSLPVIVAIHGGGYTVGSAQSSPGDAMLHASNGSVIWVGIQYRLGIHGFLGGSQIANNGVRNAGLLDQRAGLEWVSRNIRAFRGDPARVTIVGSTVRLPMSKMRSRSQLIHFSEARLPVEARSHTSSSQATHTMSHPSQPRSLSVLGGSHC